MKFLVKLVFPRRDNMSILRYPGGKSKIQKQIISRLKPYSDLEYREPFFGGGSIGLNFNSAKMWINDLDPGIFSLWYSVINYHEKLKYLTRQFVPSVEKFDQFKKDLLEGTVIDTIEFGFKKLAIHQISYSGLGVKSGGPLGGREQKSNYKIDCRWSPDYICKKIDILNSYFNKIDIKCTQLDFASVIENEDNLALIYLDPPYYVKGNELYQFGLNEKDHVRLAECLRKTNHKWFLSYDDCKEIRDLYSWANIEEIDLVYTITGLKVEGKRQSRKKSELIITGGK